MKLSCALGALAIIGLGGCGGEREVAEPAVAEEEGLGEREGIAPVAREGEVSGEGLGGGEAEEREGVVAAEGREREE